MTDTPPPPTVVDPNSPPDAARGEVEGSPGLFAQLRALGVLLAAGAGVELVYPAPGPVPALLVALASRYGMGAWQQQPDGSWTLLVRRRQGAGPGGAG